MTPGDGPDRAETIKQVCGTGRKRMPVFISTKKYLWKRNFRYFIILNFPNTFYSEILVKFNLSDLSMKYPKWSLKFKKVPEKSFQFGFQTEKVF